MTLKTPLATVLFLVSAGGLQIMCSSQGSHNTGGTSAGGGGGGAGGGACVGCPAGCETGYAHRCDGRACGDDTFGGSCGTCPQGSRCAPAGQCVGCAPSCGGKQCGDDDCGGSCGACAAGQVCSVGECVDFPTRDSNELNSIFYVNEFRTKATKYDSNDMLVLMGLPRPMSCTMNPVLNQLMSPVRLNADMVRNARRSAQHIVSYKVKNPGYNLCQHFDPVDQVGALGDRIGGFLGSQGCQNIWCGSVSPQDSPITGDPGHCECMLYGETDWGLGAFEAMNGPGIQVQDPATDAAYLPVILANEAVTTKSQTVDVYVPAKGFPGWAHLDDITDVELSEDPCFKDAKWQPYSPTLTFPLSAGEGRKVVYGRVKDKNGFTAVSWDSIYLGAEPSSLDTLKEAIGRIRSVRVPPIDIPGYDTFQYSIGVHVEMEDSIMSWFADQHFVDDPDASGGKAIWGSARGYTGGTTLPPMDGEVYVRIKSPANSDPGVIANLTWREDTGGLVGGVQVHGTDFKAPNTYQWFRMPFTHVWAESLIYFEFFSNQDVLLDRFDVYSRPIPLDETRLGGGLTLDFEGKNYRGIEIQTKLVNSASGDVADGPTINPYCPLCGAAMKAPTACSAGFADCNSDMSDGCETRTDDSVLSCGACGNACKSSGSGDIARCAQGTCVHTTIVAAQQAGASAVATDGTNLFWTNWEDGTVMKAPIAGGAPVTLATGQNRPAGIAVDGGNVYFTAIEGGVVARVPKAGGMPVVLASNQGGARAIVVDATTVFWTSWSDGSVKKMPLAGGATTVVASNVGGPTGLALDAKNVYWTSAGTPGSVFSAPKAGGMPVMLATGGVWPEGIAVDGQSIYWADIKAWKVMKTPLAGGASVEIATGQPGPRNIAVSGGAVYWTNFFGDTVMKAKISGGAPTPVASGQTFPMGIAADAGGVYWTQMSASAIPLDYKRGSVVRGAL